MDACADDSITRFNVGRVSSACSEEPPCLSELFEVCPKLIRGGGPREGAHAQVGADVVVRLALVDDPGDQGLTLVRFSAQLQPCLTQDITLHTLNTP